MARGSNIIVTSEPKGRFIEGAIATGETPKPGTIMQIQDSAGLDENGRFTFEAYNADADGARPKGPIFVLLGDDYQGRLSTGAYAAGESCFLYVPLPGDELNILLQDVSGTADTHAFGEMLIIDDGTGKLIATTGSPECEPFKLLEDVDTAPTADTLAHVIFTGY